MVESFGFSVVDFQKNGALPLGKGHGKQGGATPGQRQYVVGVR
jgi:hypothetical protein